jgi:hypothetical protein
MAYQFDDAHVERHYPVINPLIKFLDKTGETNVKDIIFFALENAEKNGISFGKHEKEPQIKHLQEQLLEHHFEQIKAEGQLRDLTDDFEKANALIKHLIAKLEDKLKPLWQAWGGPKDDVAFQLSLSETILELKDIGKYIAKETEPDGPNVFTDFGVQLETA